MKIKYLIIGAAGLILVALAIFSLLNINKAQAYTTTQDTNTFGNNIIGNDQNSQVQEATLSMKDWEYVVEPSTLKRGIPVRMTVDMQTVVGCAKDVVIKDFGVRKAVSAGNNIIEFTPTKTGTIAIACSMNMFHGTFTVIDEANPNAPAEVTAAAQPIAITGAGHICGMAAGGGCGCGGGY